MRLERTPPSLDVPETNAFSFRLGPLLQIATRWRLDSVQDLSLAEGPQMAHVPLISKS
jgi:hypothetical protein